jgi:molybdopterin adenylyltransferase
LKEVVVYSAGVLTVSDKGARGERSDTAGPALQRLLEENGFRVSACAVVPDEADKIGEVICGWVDRQAVDLVITAGGTGLSPRDVTPEATRPLLDREIPGIAETMRMASQKKTVHAMLSRGVAGIRGQSLIINLPGSEKAARENLEAVLPALPHALYKLKGGDEDCVPSEEKSGS